jgi:hypothetical protein
VHRLQARIKERNAFQGRLFQIWIIFIIFAT